MAFKSHSQKKLISVHSYGGIAQLGERLNGIQEVSGSIPLISTKMNRLVPETICFRYFFVNLKFNSDSTFFD